MEEYSHPNDGGRLRPHYRTKFTVTVVENGYIVDIDYNDQEFLNHWQKNGFEIYICKTESELSEFIADIGKKAREIQKEKTKEI